MTYQSPGLLRRSAFSAAAGSASSAGSAFSAGSTCSAGSACTSTSAASCTSTASPADGSPSKVVTVFNPLYYLQKAQPNTNRTSLVKPKSVSPTSATMKARNASTTDV